MAVKTIVTCPDRILYEASERLEEGSIGSKETLSLLGDMADTVRAENAHGLAAVQIGHPVRVFCLSSLEDDSLEFFVNPEVSIDSVPLAKSKEGCLSFPGVEGLVSRRLSLTLRWTDISGEHCSRHFEGFNARAVLHEMDHLDGVLMIDRMTPLNRRHFLKRYSKK